MKKHLIALIAIIFLSLMLIDVIDVCAGARQPAIRQPVPRSVNVRMVIRR